MSDHADKDAIKKKATLSPLVVAVLAFLVGAVTIVAIRFTAIKDDSVHYHANFALYVNGQKDEFKSFTFYEEVEACTLHDDDNVKALVHMHNQNPGLIHVHDHGRTWGQFFNNLGYTLGDKVIVTDSGVYATGQDDNKLSFILNGQATQAIANRVIKSGDKLLINYGKDSDQVLHDQYKTVPSDAHKANTEQDPASCSGSKKLTPWIRLKQSLGFGSPAQ
jgi:hypothetical protein